MRAAIYVRKSKFTGKGESINNQIELCKKYLKNMLKENIDFLIYEDEGFSGGNTNRPSFTKLMNDVKKRRFNYLVCYRLDRMGRNVADLTSTMRILEDNNVTFISITEQFDTKSIMGRTMLNITASFAQTEREIIAERIRDNMMELSKSGRWLGGTPPLGFKSIKIEYENDGHKKTMHKLELIDEEIEIVRLIFRLYLKYKSCSPIARHLVSNYIKGKNGGDFSRNTVLQILNNPVYCASDEMAINYFTKKGAMINCIDNKDLGLMVYNKKKGGKKENPIDEWIIATGKHIGVIDSITWIECQNILEEVRKKSSPRESTGNKFLLSGLMKCAHCNSSMNSWSKINKKYNRYEKYYRCELKNRASNRCVCKMLNAYKADEFVIDLLKNFELSSLDNLNSSSNSIDSADINKENIILNKALSENNKIISGLVKKIALIDDMDVLRIIQDEIKELKATNIEIEKKLNNLVIESFTIEDESKNRDDFIESLNLFKTTIDFIDDVSLKRSMIKNLVEYFTYNSETNQINFKIRL